MTAGGATGARVAVARAWLRRSAGTTFALVVLVALLGGSSSGAIAAASRSASALDRFLAFNRAPHLQVYGEDLDVEAIRALPQVIGAGEGAYGLLTVEGPDGGPFPPGVVNPFIGTNLDGVRAMRPLVVEGREPSADAADEAAVDEEASRRLGADVGDELRLRLFLPDQIQEMYDGGGAFPTPRGDEVTVRVTGIVRHPFDLNPTKPDEVEAAALASADLHLGAGFWAANGDRMAAFGGDGDGVELLLRDRRDVPAVEAAIRSMAGGDTVSIEESNDSLDAVFDARQTVRFEAVALAAFGALVAVAGWVVVGQAVARQVRADLAQRTVLVGMGLTGRDLARAASLRMGVVAVLGTAGGILLGWATSSRTPIGFGRRAEIDPGLRFDAPVLLGVAAVLGLAITGWAGWIARATSRTTAAGSLRSSSGQLAARAARLGAPVAVVTGLSQLTTRRNDARTPLRSSIGALVVAAAGVIAVGVFATSLDRFVNDPAEHGWTFDLLVGDADDPNLADGGRAAAQMLADNERVAGYGAVTAGYEDHVRLADTGRDVGIIGWEPLAGGTDLRYVEGRGPRSMEEAVLGTRTAAEAGVAVGDEVRLTGPTGEGRFRVVGIAVLHELVGNGFELDDGAVVTPDALRPLFRADGTRVGDIDFGDGTAVARYAVDVAPGVTAADAAASLRRDFGPTVIPHIPPLDVASLRSVRVLPQLFALFVGVFGLASLVHLLLVTARRRRRDFAVLASLGAGRRVLRGTVATMATAVTTAALAAGVPLGLVLGRGAWQVLAGSLGAPTPPQIPIEEVAAVVFTTVVVANVVAVFPARAVARLRPSAALRAE